MSYVTGTDKHQINFDPKANADDVKLCAGSFTAIGPNDKYVSCPYCGSVYLPSFKGKLCDTCQLAEIGANTLGILLRQI
ncbi:copa [Symbiodinium pilosum]|uniref:Copa protein n=1 Tax=Symbiodinium pilosum TaxID=2952 RepID=A0A812WHQ6_SYMPI|nr:copa [Symbiodinium pilosum]